jgi:tripartite ATP-independent transporter DctM subunit
MFARAALPEMLRRGYSPAFSSGTIAAGGTLKSLIPPSIVMILYCIVSKAFILDLFRAAIIPAIIAIGVNLLAIAITVHLNPASAPVGERMPWRERWTVIRKAAPVMFLMVAVFGGLYSGIFTVTEAASVAAVLSLLFALVRGRLNWRSLFQGLRESAAATGMIYVMIMGALIFTYFLNLGRVPEAFVAWIAHLDMPALAVIAVLLLGYLILGAVFDEISAMLITLPLVLPVVQKLAHTMMPGVSPEMVAVWWGIVNVVIIELGMIVPPIGMIVFILHGLAPQIAIRTIYRGVTPFIIADLVLLALLTSFPAITLWLPGIWPG